MQATTAPSLKLSSPVCLAAWAVTALLSFWQPPAAAQSRQPAAPAGQPRASQGMQPAASETASALDGRYRALETFARALFYLETMYIDEEKVTPETTIQHALEGIVGHLDPHTVVMPKRAFEQLTQDTRGKFGGIGVIVSQERDRLIIISPVEDTPAMKAGIKAGDEITAIDDVMVSTLKGDEAVDRMKGAPGTTIKLTIKRKGVNEPLEYSLEREIIKVKSVREVQLAANILYTRIASFQENTSDELARILSRAQANMRGLIIDLRDNPGGLLEQSVKVVDLFIESGLIVSTVGRDEDRVEREFAQKKGTFTGFPIIVLVNDGSASASEIVAGALQDHERALILGTTSFGKGSVQTLVTLPDGSGLKLTVARYYTPKDRSIQAKGITPDIVVPRDRGPNKLDPKRKRESDLSGHITSSDLSNLSQEGGLLQIIRKWPEPMQNDHQLVTAFTYLKGWSIFQKPKSQLQPRPPTAALPNETVRKS